MRFTISNEANAIGGHIEADKKELKVFKNKLSDMLENCIVIAHELWKKYPWMHEVSFSTTTEDERKIVEDSKGGNPC